MQGLTWVVHDEPEAERKVFAQDMVDWMLARSVEPVQADGAKPKL